MGFYKDNGYLNDDITIFKKIITTGTDEYGDVEKWVGTLYKGFYFNETKVIEKSKSESVPTTACFIIPVFLELLDKEEEVICLGNKSGEYDTLPDYARKIVHMVDCRRMKEIKNGSPATEWAVYV